jgi:uncharacterized RDD family membrane protein YckC
VSTSSGDYTTLVPVTGEAVALDLRLAQFPSRTLALTLDLLVQVVALVVVFGLLGALLDGTDGAAASAIALVAVVAIIVGWPTLIETLTRGRSLGKLAAGLRVVRDDGGPVRFRHSFVRALFMIVDFWALFGAIGLISSLVSSRGKRVGDHFAGTVVIRDRVPAAAGIARHVHSMPPALEGWAASLDLARLPDVTVLQARQLLSRTGTLSPEIRAALGLQLAAEVSTYITPPPPPGTHPETYLAAVLTERMRRSLAVRPATATGAPHGAAAARPAPPPRPSAAPPAGPVEHGPFTPPG